MEDWKYSQAWAEFGVACEKENKKLLDQIGKDFDRTVEMNEKLDKCDKKRRRTKNALITTISIAVFELIILVVTTI